MLQASAPAETPPSGQPRHRSELFNACTALCTSTSTFACTGCRMDSPFPLLLSFRPCLCSSGVFFSRWKEARDILKPGDLFCSSVSLAGCTERPSNSVVNQWNVTENKNIKHKDWRHTIKMFSHWMCSQRTSTTY